jgi:hypothetical protein
LERPQRVIAVQGRHALEILTEEDVAIFLYSAKLIGPAMRSAALPHLALRASRRFGHRRRETPIEEKGATGNDRCRDSSRGQRGGERHRE